MYNKDDALHTDSRIFLEFMEYRDLDYHEVKSIVEYIKSNAHPAKNFFTGAIESQALDEAARMDTDLQIEYGRMLDAKQFLSTYCGFKHLVRNVED